MQAATHLPLVPSLRASFLNCMSLYRELLLHLARDNSRPIHLKQVDGVKILEEFGRLKLWGEQTNTTRPEDVHGSLDDSLRHDEDTKAVVLGILQLLHDDLKRGIVCADSTQAALTCQTDLSRSDSFGGKDLCPNRNTK